MFAESIVLEIFGHKATLKCEFIFNITQPCAEYCIRNIFLPLCSFFLFPLKDKQTEACLVLKQSRVENRGDGND